MIVPLSTSNSSPPDTVYPWGRFWCATLFVTLAVVAGYEGVCRYRGFRPTVRDDIHTWVRARNRLVGVAAPKVVICGTSQSMLLRPEAFAKEWNCGAPVVLSIAGGNPFPTFEELCEEPLFTGLVLFDVHYSKLFSGDFCNPDGQPDRSYVDAYRRQRIADQIERRLSGLVEMTLGSRRAEVIPDPLRIYDWTRCGSWPRVQSHSSAWLGIDRVYRCDSEFQDDYPDRLRRKKEEYIPHIVKQEVPSTDAVHADHSRLRECVRSLHAKGGKVVFIRLPRDSTFFEIESSKFPREEYWDRFVREIGAETLNCEDLPELCGFTFPDGVHIDLHESQELSVRLARQLLRTGAVKITDL